MKLRSTNLFILWVVALFTTCLCECGNTSAFPEKDIAEKSMSGIDHVTKVATYTSENKHFQYLINTNGKIKSIRDKVITCEITGKLLFSVAKSGVYYTEGTVIAKIDSISIENRLVKARFAQFNSRREYESQLLSYDNLLKDKSKEIADEARLKLKISTGLAGAEQEIKEASYELSKATIRAPFTGILADVKIQENEMVKTGQELFRMYDPDDLILEVRVLEADVGLIKTGMPAEVNPISSADGKYEAVVFEINPYVDVSGMVMVKLKIRNSKLSIRRLLFPGMNCTAVIKIPTIHSVVVPKEAVVLRSGRPVVFTLEGGMAKWNYVKVGRENGTEVEILEGLKPDMKVITTNNLQLAHDAPVLETKATAVKN